MKTIYLLRHAKSSWDDSSLDDFDRPLAKRGRRAASRMAAYLRDAGMIPDLVLCSTARRTLETWQHAAPALGTEIPLQALDGLYHGAPGDLLAALRRLPAEAGSVLLIAHSPGLEQLALRLAGPGSAPDALARLREKFPTAWALAEGGGTLTRVRPKGARATL